MSQRGSAVRFSAVENQEGQLQGHVGLRLESVFAGGKEEFDHWPTPLPSVSGWSSCSPWKEGSEGMATRQTGKEAWEKLRGKAAAAAAAAVVLGGLRYL